jgi:hypothetical protein
LHLATRKRKGIYSKETRRKVAYGNRETKSKEDKSDNKTCKTKEAAAKACNFQHGVNISEIDSCDGGDSRDGG